MLPRIFNTNVFALSAVAVLTLAGASRASPPPSTDKARTPEEHRPPQVAPVSLLRPASPVGNPATRLRKPYGGTPIDVTTYHYDNNRSGWNQTETDLTPANVASPNFGLLATLNVDGNVFAQPLLVSNFVMPDGTTHDVLIIATGNNSVYAYDAQTYAVLWQVNLGTPQNSTDIGCTDVQPVFGITATPVIVRTSANAATIYLVAATEPVSMQFQAQLHALDLGTGADTITPAIIAPSATLSDGSTLQYDQQNQWTRAGLAYNNGSIYVGVGSHCDRDPGGASGWLLRYNTKLALKNAFHTIETPSLLELASIWMTGFAPAIDGNGDVYVVTGNGDFERHMKDWGESVLKLSPSASTVKSKFTPASYQTLNGMDGDFSSGGIMLVPPVAGQAAPLMAVAVGKSSVLYLLDQNNLGGIKKNDAGALQSQPAGGSGLWGGPAYYDGPAGPTVFVQTNNDVLRGWALATSATPSLTQYLAGSTVGGYGGSVPIVSSNGATPGTGVVWVERRSVPIELEAYDASALGERLVVAYGGNWSNTKQANPFVAPIEANGRVYVPAYLTVEVFGLTP